MFSARRPFFLHLQSCQEAVFPSPPSLIITCLDTTDMANVTSSSGTAYANLDWTAYIRYRPSYPPSLRQLILRHHTRHTTHHDALLDVGGGIGISALPFLGDFPTLYLLDPSPLNHDKARDFLAEHVAKHNLPTRLKFAVGKVEGYAGGERAEAIAENSGGGVSMAICATAAHFIDPAALVRAMYEMLRRVGTMAIYSYFLPIFPDLDPAVGVAFSRAAIRAMRLCVKDEPTRASFTDSGARICAGTAVLDAIAVPGSLFEDVKRISINPETAAATDIYREDSPVPFVPLPSQVGPHEEQVEYHDGKDPEAEGWVKIVDLEFLHGKIRTILPTDLELSEEQREALFGDFDRVFAAECPSGSSRAMWGLSMILGTKRE